MVVIYITLNACLIVLSFANAFVVKSLFSKLSRIIYVSAVNNQIASHGFMHHTPRG